MTTSAVIGRPSPVALDLLIGGRERIAHPEAWCQIWMAVDDHGSGCNALSPKACRWCGYGALDVTAGVVEEGSERWLARSHAARYLDRAAGHGITFSNWQDVPERTHAEVLRAFDRAIEWCRADLGVAA